MCKVNLISEFLALSIVLISSQEGLGFPDGAPGEACVRHKPNHGGKAQPLSQMPFYVTATSSTYSPDETVAGKRERVLTFKMYNFQLLSLSLNYSEDDFIERDF
jgi:hypothetical protein